MPWLRAFSQPSVLELVGHERNPGLGVHIKEPRSRMYLKFSRVDARSGKLKLLSTVSGSAELVVRTARGDSAPVALAGNQVQEILLPAGLSHAESLELRLTSRGGGTDAILRGELAP